MPSFHNKTNIHLSVLVPGYSKYTKLHSTENPFCHGPHLTVRPVTSKREFITFYPFSSMENKAISSTQFKGYLNTETIFVKYREI